MSERVRILSDEFYVSSKHVITLVYEAYGSQADVYLIRASEYTDLTDIALKFNPAESLDVSACVTHKGTLPSDALKTARVLFLGKWDHRELEKLLANPVPQSHPVVDLIEYLAGF